MKEGLILFNTTIKMFSDMEATFNVCIVPLHIAHFLLLMHN